MKLPRRLFLKSILPMFCVGPSAVFAQSTSRRFGTRLFEYLSREKLVDRQLDSVVNSALEYLIPGMPWGRVNVNDRYDQAKLNIYIINAAFKYTTVHDEQYFKKIVVNSRENFLAVPENIVVIDKLALVRVLHAAMEFWAGLQYTGALRVLANGTLADVLDGSDRSNLAPADTPQFASATWALATRRLMRIYGELLVSQEACDIVARNMVLDFEDKKRPPASPAFDLTVEMFAAALAPIIFHEIAHLKNRDQGGFLESLDGFISMVFGPSVRAREDAADKYAVKLLSDFISSNGFRNHRIAAAGVRAFMTYLTARVWVQAFQDFRGIGARQIFWQFEYVPCDKWDAWFDALQLRWADTSLELGLDPSDPVTLRSLARSPYLEMNLENPMLLRSGHSAGFPVLSAEEFSDLVNRTSGWMGDGSHAPHFLRAFGFSAIAAALLGQASGADHVEATAISRQELDKQWLSEGLRLVDAMTSGDARVMDPSQGLPYSSNLPITKATLEKTFGDVFQFYDAVNCEPGSSSIGKLRSGRVGFIELVGNASGLVRIRVATKYAQEGDDEYFGEGFENDDGKFKEAYTHLYLIGEMTGLAIDRRTLTEEESSKLTTEIVTTIRDQSASCLFASYSGRIDGAVVRLETKEDGLFVMVVDAS